MPKYDREEYIMEVEEFVGALKESDKHDWCKAVARISRNGGPATLDIRNLNLNPNSARKEGKGISLSDEEADRLVDILLEEDYGSLDVLKKAVKRKQSRFTVTNNEDEEQPWDDKYYIHINL